MILPIEYLKEEIIRTITKNSITIIEGPTGSGKSTRIPKYLADCGYKVLVTQPRILSTISLAETMSKHYNNIGFHTGLKSNFSSDNQILFLTEGTELIRQLAKKESLENTVLIIDEIHEWNINVEVLLAFAKKLINDGKHLKIVVMSATIESCKLATYLYNAPIIKIPSSNYPVTFIQKSSNTLSDTIYNAAKKNKNILVFLPGKKEISELRKNLIRTFKAHGINVRIFVLHSDIPYEYQKLIFYRYSVPKIILSTNIAQTSITIPDIDVIVDTGLNRELQLIDGIQTLITTNISKSDCLQRKGRIGRCKPGTYYLCSDFKYENRSEYPEPKISYLSLAEILLILYKFNINIDSLDFFHKPDSNRIIESIELLQKLSALNSEKELTELGIEMSNFPLDVRLSRMLVESKKYGIESDILICALLIQVGSIRVHNNVDNTIIESDLIYELELFKKAYNSSSSSESYAEIRNTSNFKKILEYIDKILPILGLEYISTEKPDISGIKKCLICAYPNQLFIFKNNLGYLKNIHSAPCHMYKNSILYSKKFKYIIGIQMNFVNDTDSYNRIIFPTAYTLNELLDYSKNLFTENYSTDGNNIYKHLFYDNIEITSFLVGTLSELRESDSYGFHEEIEYSPKFKQKYLSLYYHNLKLSSKIIN